MDRLAFLTDEHVPRVFTNVLTMRGFEVTAVREMFGQQSVDATILEKGAEIDLVVITNDRDFVRLAQDYEHAGIVMYTDRAILLDEPVAAAEGIAAIDRCYAPDEMRDVVEWLDNWL